MRRPARILLRLGVSLAVGLVLLEVGVRWLLFSEGDLAARLGAPLRQELLWADARNEDDCWKLRVRFGGERALGPHPSFDAELGWRRFDLEPGTCAHPAEGALDGDDRRLVLFYGDSFAECATERSACWAALLDRSDLGDRFVLLNFGTGGYGLGQMLLLMRRTLDRYVPGGPDTDRPIVVVGILVDDDLDRSILSLRNFPKPRFRLEGGALVLEPPAPDPAAFLERHPLGIRSYLWRYFLFGSGVVPDRVRWVLTDEEGARDEKRALNRALIEAMQAEVEARGCELFFVLFHGPSSIWTRAPHSWQEPFLYATLGELGIPFVSSKRALMEAFDRAQDRPHDYFIHEGKGRNHYDERGNQAVFEALRGGLLGEFEPLDYLRGAPVHPRDRAE